MRTQRRRPLLRHGMPGLILIWAGQVISELGSAMTRFALVFWVWQTTGQATSLSLMAFFAFGPTVLLSPVAGMVVDRWSRKAVLALSDLCAAGVSGVLLLLHLMGSLQLWHLYVAGFFAGAFAAFQFPALSAVVTTMVPRSQYGRANGLLALPDPLAAIAAPVLAGLLIARSGIAAVLLIDLGTFVVAVLTLAAAAIPRPVGDTADSRLADGFWRQCTLGFRYIWQRSGLLGLQLVFAAANLIGTWSGVLLPALVLARTGGDAAILGSVQSMFGCGGLAGAVVMSAWGGPRRRVLGVLLGMAALNLAGLVALGLGRGPGTWLPAAFLGALCLPVINGCNQAIWQAKVAPAVQGRVFATRRLIAQVTGPLAILVAGPLADGVFEPAMAAGGALAGLFAGLVGTGPGAGLSLMFVLAGLVGVGVGLAGFGVRAIRCVELLLPDHDTVAAHDQAAAPDTAATVRENVNPGAY